MNKTYERYGEAPKTHNESFPLWLFSPYGSQWEEKSRHVQSTSHLLHAFDPHLQEHQAAALPCQFSKAWDVIYLF